MLNAERSRRRRSGAKRPRRAPCSRLSWLLEPRRRQTQRAPRALRKATTHPSGFRTRGLGFRRRASAALPEAKGVTSLYARENMGALEVGPVLTRNPTGAVKRCGSLRRAHVAAGLVFWGPPHERCWSFFFCPRARSTCAPICVDMIHFLETGANVCLDAAC